MDKNKDKLDSLLVSRENNYNKDNPNYQSHYLEQYRMYLHIFNSTSDRRNKFNEFFLGLNTAIIGIIGLIETKSVTSEGTAILVFAPLVGIAICYYWHKFIIAYKKLNKAKFAVIHKIEEGLPIEPFKTEWEFLGKGLDNNKYDRISDIEKRIPMIFIILYIIIFILSLPINII